MPRTDILDRELTVQEAEIMELHERLTTLANEKDLAPCAAANLKFAAAAVAQVVGNLGLDWCHDQDTA